MEPLNLRFKDGRPDKIAIEMTVEQAAHLTKLVGKISPANAATPEDYNAQSELYNVLVGSLFNRYWDDGVDGYLRGEWYE